MKKIAISGIIAGALAFLTMLYVAEPEMTQQQTKKLTAPITRFLNERDAEKWQQAKNAAQTEWMQRYKIAPDCINPRTELKNEECRNQQDQWAIAFERHWQQRIESGWKPE